MKLPEPQINQNNVRNSVSIKEEKQRKRLLEDVKNLIDNDRNMEQQYLSSARGNCRSQRRVQAGFVISNKIELK